MGKTVKGINDFYTNQTEKLIVIKYEDGVISEDEIKEILKR